MSETSNNNIAHFTTFFRLTVIIYDNNRDVLHRQVDTVQVSRDIDKEILFIFNACAFVDDGD